MTHRPTRRDALAFGSAALGAALLPHFPEETVAAPSQSQRTRSQSEPFGYCFNTSTIRGQKLPIDQVIDLVARAGWDGIEPWIDEITHYVDAGGSLKDLGKRIADAGLQVPSAIGFAEWIVDDPAQRKAGMEQARVEMDLVAQLGGTAIAAPPAGAQNTGGIDLFVAAERYHALCEIGRGIGVVPQVEVWGFSKQLKHLGEAVLVAVESGHPDACVLADVYHIYKGGSSFEGMKLLSAHALRHLHVNDYPADPPRETIGDEHRVYPGEGVAPLSEFLQTLRDVGFSGMLSLELFNKTLYQQDPFEVAKTGLEKTRGAVRKALVP